MHTNNILFKPLLLLIFRLYFVTMPIDRRTPTMACTVCGEEFLGGRVEFSSTGTDGTIFSFTLPPLIPPWMQLNGV